MGMRDSPNFGVVVSVCFCLFLFVCLFFLFLSLKGRSCNQEPIDSWLSYYTGKEEEKSRKFFREKSFSPLPN